MRNVIPLVLIAAVAGCTAAPPPAAVASPKAQARLAQLLAGKVPGQPHTCLPSYRSEQMIVIDDRTIVFRDSPSRVWVMHPRNECNLLSAGPYALVTRTPTSQLCAGEIGRVVDTLNGSTVGTCVIGEFVPYSPPPV